MDRPDISVFYLFSLSPTIYEQPYYLYHSYLIYSFGHFVILYPKTLKEEGVSNI